ADHIALRHVVVGAAGRVGALRGEDLVEVAVIGLAGVLLGALPVALRARLGDERTERARLLTLIRRPVEAVALAWVAQEPPGVVEEFRLLGIARVVLAL